MPCSFSITFSACSSAFPSHGLWHIVYSLDNAVAHWDSWKFLGHSEILCPLSITQTPSAGCHQYAPCMILIQKQQFYMPFHFKNPPESSAKGMAVHYINWLWEHITVVVVVIIIRIRVRIRIKRIRIKGRGRRRVQFSKQVFDNQSKYFSYVKRILWDIVNFCSYEN